MTLESLRILPSLRRTLGLSKVFVAFLFVLLAAVVIDGPRASAQQSHVDRDFAKVPLSFEANRGQVDPRVKFVSRGPGYALFLTGNEAVIEIQKQTSSKDHPVAAQSAPLPVSTLKMQLLGANPAAQVTAGDVLPGTANYFTGSDPKKWQTDIPTYKRVNYQAVYPGVDLVYYGNQRQLEYDFVVAPGADPQKITLGFTGATPKLDRATGDLVLAVSIGETRFHKPVVYQMTGDRRVPVDGHYIVAKNEVHFALGRYDKSKPLVIDPVLSYLTYIGGSSNDLINGIAIDSSSSAYIVARSFSLDYPLQNAYQSTNTGSSIDSRNSSIAVSKFNATGSALVYSTYLTGSNATIGDAIAVDSSGNAYVGGYTNSNDYPVTAGSFETLCGAGYNVQNNQVVRIPGCASSSSYSGVLTKLNPAGNGLVYSTFLGGDDFNAIQGVAVDSAGQAYVTGISNAFCGPGPYYPSPNYVDSCQAYANFPITNGSAQNSTDPIATGNSFSFLTKFNAAGSALLYSSILGNGSSTPYSTATPDGYAVAIDPSGNAYIGGQAIQYLFTTPGSYQPSIGSAAGGHAFVAKFDTVAQKLVYSTFVTGNASGDAVYGIAADAAGNAYIAGSTSECAFPTTPGAYQTQGRFPAGASANCNAGFVSKLSPRGDALVWSTFMGNDATSGNNAYLNAITLGSDGSVYVAGQVNGGGFPFVNPIQTQTDFNAKALIARLNPSGSALLFATSLGGVSTSSDAATGIAVDGAGNIYIAGQTNGYSLPVTPGVFQPTSKLATGCCGNATGFVAKIAPFLTSTTSLTLSSTSVNAGQPVTLTATVTGPAGSPVPTGTITFLNGSTALGTATLDSTGKATYNTSLLGATTYTLSASYSGDANYSASTSSTQTLVVNPLPTATALTINPSRVVAGTTVSLAAKVTPASGAGIPTGTVTFTNGTTQLAAVALDSTGAATFTSSTLPVGSYSITATYSGDMTYNSSTVSAAITVIASGGTAGLQFIPVTPCRVADTRNPNGAFGGPILGGGTTREFDIPQSNCGIPTTAVAYSLNVTVVPNSTLNYLTLWPTGVTQPYVSTLNSDGRVKANAAITPAGTNGGVNIFVSDATNVILDIDGYFVPAGTASALAFYPVTPCRVSDTRSAAGPLGGPFIAGNTHRDFPVQSSNCGIPTNAKAYSLNVTAVPHSTLNYLTAWSTGQTQPNVSTLNSSTGAVAANAAIVPASTNGDVSIFVSDDADVILDVNGYFAAPAANGLSLYTTTPCRITDTRSANGAFNGTLVVGAQTSTCAPPSAAQAYVLNATVVPSGSLNYLSIWSNGQAQPYVSTLNARDGAITSNMAIVPNVNGSIDVFSSDPTNAILDISSYFAP